MRRIAPACLLLSTLGCFEDLGPLPTDDEVGATESTSDGDTESSESGSSESESAEIDSTADDSTADDSTDSSESDTTDGDRIEGTYEPCTDDHTCPAGGTCNTIENGWFEFGICVPVGCSDTMICPPPPPEIGVSGAICNDEGECMVNCDTNSECGMGLVCSANHSCYFNEFWGPCSTPLNCAMGSSCVGVSNTSTCLPLCALDSDCPPINRDGIAEAVCMAPFCEIPCNLDEDCPVPMGCIGDVCRYSGSNP